MKIFSRNSKEKETNLYLLKIDNMLSENQLLQATLVEKIDDCSIIRFDASISKIGKFYKFILTKKTDNQSIKYTQKDFFSAAELNEYIATETSFLITDFHNKMRLTKNTLPERVETKPKFKSELV